MSLNLKTVSRYECSQKLKCQKNCILFIEDYKVSDIVDSTLLLTCKYYNLYV